MDNSPPRLKLLDPCRGRAEPQLIWAPLPMALVTRCVRVQCKVSYSLM